MCRKIHVTQTNKTHKLKIQMILPTYVEEEEDGTTYIEKKDESDPNEMKEKN